jgi:hypothetical protein
MYTPSQLALLAAAQLLAQVKAQSAAESALRGSPREDTRNAWDALIRWYGENGLEEPTRMNYGWYYVGPEQLAAVAQQGLTPLPVISLLQEHQTEETPSGDEKPLKKDNVAFGDFPGEFHLLR